MQAVRVAESNINGAGKGLFASRTILRGEYICEYTGYIVTAAVISPGELKYSVILGEEFLVGTGEASLINDSIDLNKSTKQKIIRVNWNVSLVKMSVENRTTVFVKAIQEIPAGDELYLNYGDNYWLDKLPE